MSGVMKTLNTQMVIIRAKQIIKMEDHQALLIKKSMICSVKTQEVTQRPLLEMAGFMLKDLTVMVQEQVVLTMVPQILKTLPHFLVEPCHSQTAKKNVTRLMAVQESQLDYRDKMVLTLATEKVIST
jgi:hypothetical protein